MISNPCKFSGVIDNPRRFSGVTANLHRLKKKKAIRGRRPARDGESRCVVCVCISVCACGLIHRCRASVGITFKRK